MLPDLLPSLLSIFASAARSIASGGSTPLGSGASTPVPNDTAGTSTMSPMARSKKEFARLKLYASFVRGEVISFKPEPVSFGSSGTNEASSSSGTATPAFQHKIMKSQLWNVQPASASSSASSSPAPVLSKVDKKAEKELGRAAKRARKAEKEAKRSEREARRVEKDRKRALKAAAKEAKIQQADSSTEGVGKSDTKRKRDQADQDGETDTVEESGRKRRRDGADDDSENRKKEKKKSKRDSKAV